MRSSVVCASWLPSINNMYILCYVIVHLSIIYKIRHAPLHKTCKFLLLKFVNVSFIKYILCAVPVKSGRLEMFKWAHANGC